LIASQTRMRLLAFVLTLCFISHAAAIMKKQQLAGLEEAQGAFPLWNFVKPQDFTATCLKVTAAIGDKSANTELARSECNAATDAMAKAASPPAKADDHCKFFAIQIETATLDESYRGGPDFCGLMLQWHSYQGKIDLLDYLSTDEKWQICTDAITSAVEQGVGGDKTAAIQANLPVTCKEETEKKFKASGLPFQIATTACKHFVAKANKALSGTELDPEDNGKAFCDGNTMQATAFEKSEPSPMPEGFPLTEGDWVPKVTLANLKVLVRKLFPTPRDAWAKFDKNADGKLDEKEWNAMCEALKVPSWDAKTLLAAIDKDKSGDVSEEEWEDVMGVTLEELVGYVLAKHKNSDHSLKAADSNGDGKVDEAEWNAHCAEVKVSEVNAKLLWAQVDTDGSGDISATEYEKAFGVTVPELKKRSAAEFGTPEASFEAFDTSGDGTIDADEFKAGCELLGIPADQADRLFPLLDKDTGASISPEEWTDQMGLDDEDVRQQVMDKLGNPAEAFKKISPDGKPASAEDAAKALEAAGLSPEEAAAVADELDKDGDGKISAAEFAKATGADELADAKNAAPGAAGALGGLGTPEEAMKAMDTDGDGVVSEDEIAAGMAKAGGAASPEEVKALMKEMDKDGDGKVTPEELKEALEKGKGPADVSSPEGAAGATGSVGGAMGQPGGVGMGPGGTGGAGPPLPNGEAEVTLPEFMKRAKDTFGTPKQAYKVFDKDGDGEVTPEEFAAGCANLKPPVSPAQASPLFEKMDGDKSGGITPDEFYAEMGGEEGFAEGLTVPEFKRRAKDTFGSPKDAYAALDADGDGNVTPEEFAAGCAKLKPPVAPSQAPELFKKLDADGSGKMTPEEFYDTMGAPDAFAGPALTLPEFKKRAKESFGSPKDAYAAFDADGDGKVSPEEFEAGAAKLKPPVSKQEAMPLFELLDKNKDGGIEPKEFYDACGAEDTFAPSPGDDSYVGVDELKKRAAGAFESPKEALAALDADGDGNITPEELMAGAAKMKPPMSKEEALALQKQLDADGDGVISPEEFYDKVGSPEKFAPSPGDPDYIDVDEFKKRAKKAHGSPEDAFKSADANGDGKMSPEEFAKHCAGLEPPIPPEAVPDLFKEMDKNGDGSIEPAEFYASVGPPDAFTASPGDPDFVDVPEFKKRAKATYGTPKAAYEAFDSAAADGKISADEFLAGCAKLKPPIAKEAALPLMKELDTNGDGSIQPEEFYDLVGPPEGFTPSKGEPGFIGVPEFKKAAAGTYGSPKEAFAGMDADGDGKISPEEFKTAAAKMTPPIPPEQVPALMKEMDANGDGVIQPEEFYAATGSPDEFAPDAGGAGAGEPRKAPESDITMPEFKERALQAFKNGKEAWDAIAGPDAASVTLDDFKKKAADIGLTPAQAEKIFNEMDPNGDGIVSKGDFQNAIGMDEDEARARMLDTFGSAQEAMKAADKDGDGNVSKEELQAMYEEAGITPENAAKMADEMMQKLDPAGTGKISGKTFVEATKARASDLTDRIEAKMGSVGEAMKKWDKDGDGCLTEAEFVEGAKSTGISEKAAKDMFQDKAKGEDKICGDAFAKAFGIGPDQLMERCFKHFGNPGKAFYAADMDGDGLISKSEFVKIAEEMKLKPDQIDRLFKDMDSNHNEATELHISKWEMYHYMDYEDARFITFQDGYGDVDPWGSEHKKFNELPPVPPAPKKPKPAKKALLHHTTKFRRSELRRGLAVRRLMAE